MSGKTDDLEAVRVLAETLQPFTVEDQERIIRWARENWGWRPQRRPSRQRARTPCPRNRLRPR